MTTNFQKDLDLQEPGQLHDRFLEDNGEYLLFCLRLFFIPTVLTLPSKQLCICLPAVPRLGLAPLMRAF